MQFWAEFADWDKLTRVYEAKGAECLEKMDKVDRDGIFENAVEPHIGDSNIMNMDASQMAQFMREHLSARNTERAYDFLRYFCTYLEGDNRRSLFCRCKDIGLDAERMGVVSIQSPDTVRAIYNAYQKFPWFWVRRAAKKVWKKKSNWFDTEPESYQVLLDYFAAWGGVYEKATESGRGLVFWNC